MFANKKGENGHFCGETCYTVHILSPRKTNKERNEKKEKLGVCQKWLICLIKNRQVFFPVECLDYLG